MPTTSPNMSLQIPLLNGEPGSWDTSLNLSLGILDAHTHQPGSGVLIRPNAIGINADLTFAGNAATNLKAINFFAQSTYTTNLSLFVDSDDNELYWRSNAGAFVKITSGTGLNLSLVGGITGDYAAAGAALYYDNTAEAYRFLEAAPGANDWSYVKAGGFDLYEHDSGIANFIGLRSPSLLAASYNLTLPGALPASTVLAQVSSAGVVTFTNAHGDKSKTQNGSAATADDATKWVVAANGQGRQSTAADKCYLCPEFEVGQRVKSVSISRAGDGTVDCTFTIYACNASTTTSIGTATASNITSGSTVIDLTDTTIAAGDTIVLESDANATNFILESATWTFDRPS